MSIAIIPAILLSLLTSAFVYVLWYILRGRHSKTVTKRKKKTEEEAEEEKQKGKWGISPDSYCYPAINDILGWEFVHVVQLEGLTDSMGMDGGETAGNARRTERKRNVTTVPLQNGQKAADAFAGLNRGNEIPDEIGREDEPPSQTRHNIQDYEPEEELTEDDWPEYEPENEVYEISDSDFDNLIKNNADKIENEPLTDDEKAEQQKLNQRMEAMKRQLEALDDNSNEIMDKIKDIEF